MGFERQAAGLVREASSSPRKPTATLEGGWVSTSFPGKRTPAVDILKSWITESYS
jgi:hypothetical protein